ncbi:DUF4446 family protein [bacterium]|nr:MAG: DUF4446 family protein [bacterium]
MDVLSRSLTQPGSGAFFVLLGSIVLLAGTLALTITRQRRFERRYQDLLVGANGESFEAILLDHLGARERLEREVGSLNARVEELERRARRAKRYSGLVRYDAFEDVGGEQSFALAIYDEEGDGVVISSLVGRIDCRVYAKPLVGGQSERALSQEERRAIQEAATGTTKAIVSH